MPSRVNAKYRTCALSGQSLALCSHLVTDVRGGGPMSCWYDPRMSRTLVLNASNEPLSVVTARRAVVLLLRERADLVAPLGLTWHAASVVFDVPAVVRLRRYVPVPYARSVPISRRAVFMRDQHSCQYCGASAENVDHVVPKVQGGEHRWDNVVAACRRCNTRKGGRTPAQAGLVLRKAPMKPGRFDWVQIAAGGTPHASWGPFL
jgi:5-methylcytosine-specific restriction endonuclease McrA